MRRLITLAALRVTDRDEFLKAGGPSRPRAGQTMIVAPPGCSSALGFRPAQGAPAEEKLSITFPLRNPISVPFQERVLTAFEMF